jgi:hypothetical protein
MAALKEPSRIPHAPRIPIEPQVTDGPAVRAMTAPVRSDRRPPPAGR